MEIKIDFRVNDSRIEPDFSDNALSLDDMENTLAGIAGDSTVTITSVTLCGTASPEGSDSYNRHLAGARRAALERLVRSKVCIPDSIITYDDTYIPWDWLREQLTESGLDCRDSVISIIGMAPRLVRDPGNGRLVDHRIVRLRQLDNRRVWNRLFRLYFDKMRNAMAVIITCKKDGHPVCPGLTDSVTAGQSTALGKPGLIPDTLVSSMTPASIPASGTLRRGGHKPVRLSLRTNMLYDALAIPNIGVEFRLGRKWSVAANWMYAWWNSDRRHRYWRVYGGDAGVNFWFGKASRGRALTGHHAGVYAQMLTYDIELGGAGRLGDRWTYGAGVQYGYSLPVGRHLNIDFTIGFGYVRGEYKKYHPADGCYVWDSTHMLNWFGPTKAEVSLVWLIGSGDPEKGGGR